jgi:signal transduction histidine kinase/FixJ family two-component response regulator
MEITREIIQFDNIAFAPIVQPEQLSGFEAFMYDYFASEPAIPPGAGEHSFGRGVYAADAENGTYHDTTGVTRRFHSDNTFLAPLLQLLFSNGTSAAQLTYNLHSDPEFGPAMDRIVDVCSPAHNYTVASRYCGWISEASPVLTSTAQNATPQISDFRSTIIQPIYLQQNSSKVAGFVGSAINWQRMLAVNFPGNSGLMCVVVQSTVTFSYKVSLGRADFAGLGDRHDTQYSGNAHILNTSVSTLRDTDTAPYVVYVYPTDEYVQAFLTNTPTYVGVAVGLILGLAGVIFVLYDRQLRREARRQLDLLTSKRQFVRFISHEIRTPLNSVHLGLELLTEELKVTAAQLAAASTLTMDLFSSLREMVQGWQELALDMVSNGDSAVDVLNDLLNYDKIEMGTLRLDFAYVGIFTQVEKVTKAFQMQARQKGITLSLQGCCWEPARLTEEELNRYRNLVVIGDHSRIAQILRNVMSNALKFTPSDGTITVTAAWDAKGLASARAPPLPQEKADLKDLPRAGSIRVAIRDSGVGLSPDQLSQVCSEGVQFNANLLQAGQGSGLGLFISRGLAEQHSGTLTVTSEGLGYGSTFTLELPLYLKPSSPTAALLGHPRRSPQQVSFDVEEGIVRSETKSLSSASSRRGTQCRRILVVDDAVSNRKLLVRLLKARGYVCEQAENGQHALDVYRNLCERGVPLETIVMDYEMPVMDGPTATRLLREAGCDLLIIGVTGNLLPEDVNYFKEQGADAVLGKPLDVKLFEELVVDLRETAAEERKPGDEAAAVGADMGGETATVVSMQQLGVSGVKAEQKKDVGAAEVGGALDVV